MHLAELSELLAGPSVADRLLLRSKVQEAQRGMRNAGSDDGLLALLLRNMLIDLAKASGHFDPAYFAHQLARVTERLA